MPNTNNPDEDDSSKKREKPSGAEGHVTEEAGSGKAADEDNKDAGSRKNEQRKEYQSFANVLSGSDFIESALRKGLGKEEGERGSPLRLPKVPDGKSELKMACAKASKEITSKFQFPEIDLGLAIRKTFEQYAGKEPIPENLPMEVELEPSTSKATSLNKAGPSGAMAKAGPSGAMAKARPSGTMAKAGTSSRKSLSKGTCPGVASRLPIEPGPRGATSLPLFHEDDVLTYKKSTSADLEKELRGMKSILEQRALDLLTTKECVLINKKDVRRLDIFVPICDFTAMNYRTMAGYDGRTYRIVIDMSFFEPENIIVQVVRDTVNVFATAEYESSEGYQNAEFHEVYTLPDDVNKDKVKAHMPHPLKMLCICAPVKRTFD